MKTLNLGENINIKPRQTVVEAGAALPLDGGVKCYGGYRSVPEDVSPRRNGLKKEIEKNE